MTLTLYYHPLSSFSQKALIALYENDTKFTPNLLDPGDAAQRAAYLDMWPVGKFPLLHDSKDDRTIPESSIIIEYLAQHYPGPSKLVPADPDLARQTRLRDRFFDLYVNAQMQRIIADRLRAADRKDPQGVEEARAMLKTAYDMIESEVDNQTWAMGETFTMADVAAAPALFYANIVQPFGHTHPGTMAYWQRLAKRPSYARVLKEAEPYLHLVPK